MAPSGRGGGRGWPGRRPVVAVFAVLVAGLVGACSSDDPTDDASATTVPSTAPSQASATTLPGLDQLPGCRAEGEVSGAVEASFAQVPAQTDITGTGEGAPDSRFYQVANEGVTVFFRLAPDGTPLVMVREGDRQFTARGADGLEVEADGSGASAAGVEAAGDGETAQLDLRIICGSS